MTSLDEKIKNAKRDAMILWLEDKHYRYMSSAEWEAMYIKKLMDEKAEEEKSEQERTGTTD